MLVGSGAGERGMRTHKGYYYYFCQVDRGLRKNDPRKKTIEKTGSEKREETC